VLKAYADNWALISGASTGIGAEFARKLAARGMHLVLTARRRELLEQLAAELHTAHGTKCEIVVLDLADPESPRQLLETIEQRGITIELLVNNAGFGQIGEIADADVDRMMEMIRLNIGALTELTYRLLPGMIERGHGAIINVSSVAAFQPVAYMATYAASKAYVLHFSEALWVEAREKGVTVMALCPGTTRTDFFNVAGANGWLAKRRAHSPSQVVRTALKALEKKRQYVIPGWRNYLLALLVRIVNRRTVVRESMKYFRPSRKKVKHEKEPSRDIVSTSDVPH